MIGPPTPEGAVASALLADAAVIWMTTVRPDGQPQSSPVWFVIDDGEFLIFSMPTPRIDNLGVNPRVSLNLDSNEGSDVVIVEGRARIVDKPSSADHPGYREKYQRRIEQMGTTVDDFAATYSIPIRVTPTRWRVY